MKEIKVRKDYTGTDIIETIYFGGGTPSLLLPDELEEIMQTVRDHFEIDPGAEITLEANPDDIDEERLNAWRKAGINRLSIGVQSFFDEDLKWMNRSHNAGKALEAIRAARRNGFYNITIDLIFGVPGLTDDRWKRNVELALEEDISHLSCYALTVEPRTALKKMIDLKKTDDIKTDDQARQFLLLTDWLTAAGYEQYEISNFAKPGYRSRHNSSYWQGKHYLGLGPSAHSFNGHSRQWNIANNALYIQHLKTGAPSFETEILNQDQQLNEFIMIALRTIEGIDIQRFTNQFGASEASRILLLSKKYEQEGKMEIGAERIRLTPQGRLFADGIAADLFA